MHVLYEEDGAFRAGTVLADQGGAFQVESSSGKRAKVKAAQILVQFQEPAPVPLMREAAQLADAIDLAFLWECAPQEEFGFLEFGREYFGHAPSSIESTALLMRLHAAPMYFYRKGRGRYKPAPSEALKAALAGAERKKRQSELQSVYVAQLKENRLPDALREHTRDLLFKPDKNSVEYKALEEAARERAISPVRLLLATGALASAKELHRQRFLAEYFARGTGFAAPVVPPAGLDLPRAAVSAFSIDDHTTTEIDDAFSVAPIDGGWRIGVHIAAPGLAIRPGDPIDRLARERFSTVYTPGEKITMLPPAVIEAFTLAAGRDCAALSLYFDVSGEDWSVRSSHSRAERVRISHNLRHRDLDPFLTEEALASGAGDYPCKEAIVPLWHFATALYQRRQLARVASGLRPETNQRSDYNFYIESKDGVECVIISERQRGAPLDKLVAELMVLANSTWGKLLSENSVPAIYRVQSGFGPAGKVRMTTQPGPHQGLGVAQYAWSTSPLRRYVDLVNQWQILSCIGTGPSAFEKNDVELFAVVSGFEAAYAAYAEFQATMERYWCLRWLVQNGIRVTEGLVQREDWVRLEDIPLQLRVPGVPTLPRGTRVELEILATDEIDLTVECRLLAIIEEVDDPALLEGAGGDFEEEASSA